MELCKKCNTHFADKGDYCTFCNPQKANIFQEQVSAEQQEQKQSLQAPGISISQHQSQSSGGKQQQSIAQPNSKKSVISQKTNIRPLLWGSFIAIVVYFFFTVFHRDSVFTFSAEYFIEKDKNVLQQALRDVPKVTTKNWKDKEKGFEVSIGYSGGIDNFVNIFRLSCQNRIDVHCEKYLNTIFVYPVIKKPNFIGTEKFKGKVVVYPDEKIIKNKMTELVRQNHLLFAQKLQEFLQNKIPLYDPISVEKKERIEQIQSGVLAAVDPVKYLVKRFYRYTHICCFWVKPYLKKQRKSEYYFVEGGLRMIRVRDGRIFGTFHFDLIPPVKVENGKKEACQSIIDRLARQASRKLLEQLLKDHPNKFKIPDPKDPLLVRGDDFALEDVKKISEALLDLERDNEIKIVEQGEQIVHNSFKYRVKLLKQSDQKQHNQVSLRQRLIEKFEEKGVLAKIDTIYRELTEI